MPVEGRSPLHNAALEGGDRLRQLVSEGADVRARDAKGRTPLHNACQRQPMHVPLLLAAGADPNANYMSITGVGVKGCRADLAYPQRVLGELDNNFGCYAVFH